MEWSQFIQGLTQTAANVYADKVKAEQQYKVGALELQTAMVNKTTAMPVTGSGLSPTVLIVGAVALVAVLVLSDRK